MVFWQLLAAVRRRPLITLVGLLLSAGLVVMVSRPPGVYSTEVSAIFLNPAPPGTRDAALANPLDSTDPNLISAAGIVSRMINAGTSTSLSGSDAVSLVAKGVKHGYSVTLPNSGGQWVVQYDRPLLDVQVVGRSPEEVDALLAQAMTQIRSTLQAQEKQSGAARDQWIRVLEDPQRPVVAVGQGNRHRAMAVALFLGLMLTLTAVQLLQEGGGPIRRLLRLVRRRRSKDGDSGRSGHGIQITDPQPAGRQHAGVV